MSFGAITPLLPNRKTKTFLQEATEITEKCLLCFLCVLLLNFFCFWLLHIRAYPCDPWLNGHSGDFVMIILLPWLLFLGFMFVMSLLWLYAIIDVSRREFSDSTTKLIWLLVVIFVYGIGTIIYLVFGRQQGRLY